MTLARLLACLLGPPRDVPMDRLLDLDQRAFNHRVRAVRHPEATDARPPGPHTLFDHSHAYAALATTGDRTT